MQRGSINWCPARGALIHGRQAPHVTDVTNWGLRSGAERRPDPRCRLGPPYRRWGTGAGPAARAPIRRSTAPSTGGRWGGGGGGHQRATPRHSGRGPDGRPVDPCRLPLHATRRSGRAGGRARHDDLI